MCRRGLLIWLLFVLGCFVGCGGSVESSGPAAGGGTEGETSDTADAGETRGVIGFSALTLKNPFFKIIADTLTDEAKQHGWEVIVTDAADDVHQQANHIDNFIAQRVTAIVLNPADRIAIGPAIQKANEAGIPVFTCDLQCVAEGAEIAGHVGTDNFQGGKLAGEAMIEALGEAGGDVLILHKKAANSCVLRVDGFRQVIDAYNEGRESGRINLVAELEGAGDEDISYKATLDALQGNQNLAGIFAINDPSALGAWKALDQSTKTDQVVIVGFDGQMEGKQAIKEGKIHADPIQFPDRIAAQTVDKIAKYLNGEEYEKVELIPTQLYRQADAEAELK
ncbi:MAG: substrate-binding domain-containing protein [Planctomycetales bacterium]|nr:substrate-binding domain-containing protein [Planctomycetales bacterium]